MSFIIGGGSRGCSSVLRIGYSARIPGYLIAGGNKYFLLTVGGFAVQILVDMCGVVKQFGHDISGCVGGRAASYFPLAKELISRKTVLSHLVIVQ